MRSLREATALFVLSATVFLLFGKPQPWIEADFQVRRSESLVMQGTLASDERRLPFDILGPDQRYYDVHGLLNVLIHVPVVAADRVVATVTGRADTSRSRQFIAARSGAIIGALAIVSFYFLLRGLLVSTRAAVLTSGALAFATIMLPYFATNYEGNADVLCLVTAAACLFRSWRDERRRTRWTALCGAACGLALLGREHNLIVIGVCGAFVAADAIARRSLRDAAAFAAAMLPFVCVFGWYNHVRTGTVTQTAIMFQIRQGMYPFFEPRGIDGIVSLLVSPGGSVFVYSPPLVLALAGFGVGFRRHRRALIFVLACALLTLIAVGLNEHWYGFSTWGPRYLNPSVPFLLMPLAFWLDRHADAARRQRSTRVFAFVVAVGFLIQVAGTLVDWLRREGALLASAGSAEQVAWSPLFYDVRRAQWAQMLLSLARNTRAIVTGTTDPTESAQIAVNISAGTRYTALTLDTWWNRAWFEGVPGWLIAVYVAASLAIIAASIVTLRRCLDQNIAP